MGTIQVIGDKRRNGCNEIVPARPSGIEPVRAGRLEPDVVAAIEQGAERPHIGAVGVPDGHRDGPYGRSPAAPASRPGAGEGHPRYQPRNRRRRANLPAAAAPRRGTCPWAHRRLAACPHLEGRAVQLVIDQMDALLPGGRRVRAPDAKGRARISGRIAGHADCNRGELCRIAAIKAAPTVSCCARMGVRLMHISQHGVDGSRAPVTPFAKSDLSSGGMRC